MSLTSDARFNITLLTPAYRSMFPGYLKLHTVSREGVSEATKKGTDPMVRPSRSVLVVHPLSNLVTQLTHASMLRPGYPVTPNRDCLGLLPSGPDPIHRLPPHETQPSTPADAAVLLTADPRRGIRLRCSGLRIQGTAGSPSSTTKHMVA